MVLGEVTLKPAKHYTPQPLTLNRPRKRSKLSGFSYGSQTYQTSTLASNTHKGNPYLRNLYPVWQGVGDKNACIQKKDAVNPEPFKQQSQDGNPPKRSLRSMSHPTQDSKFRIASLKCLKPKSINIPRAPWDSQRLKADSRKNQKRAPSERLRALELYRRMRALAPTFANGHGDGLAQKKLAC